MRMGELGPLLSRQREARGLTLDDAERDTRISKRYLQALEAEQFDVIPAPVYARGFLRSYSQYLGLDPQQMLSLFPREGQPEPEQVEIIGADTRSRVNQPPSAVGPPRPVSRRPGPPPPTLSGRKTTKRDEPLAYPLEPTIGVDIGVPSPTRRIRTDPAAQTRSWTVIIVAAAVILGTIFLAFVILKLGGDGSNTPDTSAPTTRPGATTSGTRPAFPPNSTQVPIATDSGTQAVQTPKPGVVPDVTGLNFVAARKQLTDLGYSVKENRGKNSAPKDTVFDQSPAPGFALEAKQMVTILISDGP